MQLLHSKDIPGVYIKKIASLLPGIKTISITGSSGVYRSIANHPDIFMCQLDRNTIVYSKSIKENELNALRASGVRLLRSNTVPSGNYPGTAPFNGVRVGGYFLHKLELTDTLIKNEAQNLGLKLVNINQGYARCSVLPVGERAIITSDEGIKDAAIKERVKVKVVSPGNIDLPGEKFGFLGGASGVMPDGKILFLGDIATHPDFKEIDSFIKKQKIEYISLKGVPLLDAGSLIFLG